MSWVLTKCWKNYTSYRHCHVSFFWKHNISISHKVSLFFLPPSLPPDFPPWPPVSVGMSWPLGSFSYRQASTVFVLVIQFGLQPSAVAAVSTSYCSSKGNCSNKWRYLCSVQSSSSKILASAIWRSSISYNPLVATAWRDKVDKPIYKFDWQGGQKTCFGSYLDIVLMCLYTTLRTEIKEDCVLWGALHL